MFHVEQLTDEQKPDWRGVFFDGPFAKEDPKQEQPEKPFWTVYVGRDWNEPVRTVYQVNNFKRAESLARVMSTDRNLELIAEAMPA